MDDGAEAVIAALDHGQSGAYNIVDDDPAPASEWLPYFARTIGARPPLRLPVWLGRLIGGEALTAMMTDARGVSNEKAKRELGWKPRWSSWREGFAQALTM
jgi:nucleoside-diphosphate-sugar epimerase